MRLEFDLNNNVEKPEIILGKRNYDKLGAIVNIENLTYDYNLMSADSISFTVYKELNYEKEPLWDEIKDRRLIWLKEFNEWFQIDVVINDEKGITKEVTGTSLCEAELSQILIKSTEINTENDIAREDYKNPTIFYKPANPEESLLHRLLKEAPNYSIKYVDDSLYNIQRTFSIDSTSIYDELTGEIAEEIGCLFLFDSTDRSISVYDLKTNCLHCGYRGDYTDICPECGSTDLNYGYGNDTAIFVDSETLAQNISLSGKQEEVKNYIKVSGGDDKMNTAISACNPTGTQYIYAFSDRDKEDMSDELSAKLDEYLTKCEELTPAYQDIMEDLYDALDKQLKLNSAMMPDIETAETNAAKELAKLTSENLNPIAVEDISTASVYTVNNAVLGMAKCIVNSTVYDIRLIDNSTSFAGRTWKGKFRIENFSDENDAAENTGYITLTINDDREYYLEQKIKKTIDRDDIYLVDIFDIKTDLDVFTAELKKYCLNRLSSFETAYKTIVNILINENCGNSSVYGDIYNDLYLPYHNKLTAIKKEINIRITEIETVNGELAELKKSKTEINKQLNLQNYLGDKLWKELCSFRREDSYENSNYISDGLDDRQLFKKAEELLEKANIEAVTASTLQLSLSATMLNLLALPEFKKLTGMFEGGNWIRIGLDNKIYRLRLIHYKIDFSEIQNIEVEFSDVTQTVNGLNDTKSLMNAVSSMVSSFSYVAHQAEQGSKSFAELDKIRNDGLNAALYNISSSVNQEFIIDQHGITGRQWDDILGKYLPEQVKFTNNCLVYTDDYWQTAKAALGKIEYYNPILKETKSKYGLLADAVITGILMGNDIIGGDIYSENYSNSSGTHINLNDGTFSFGGGLLTYNGASLNLTGVINAEKGGSIAGFAISDKAIYNGTGSLASTAEGIYLGTDGIRQYKSPTANVTISNGILTANGLIANGANINGTIISDSLKATGGNIGGWTIGTSTLTGGNIILNSNGSISGGSAYKWSISTNGSAIFNSLTAAGADISGKITATDGSIAGNLTIGGSLTHTFGNYTVTLRGVQSDLSYGVLYITDKSKGTETYPFRVNGDGSFTAAKATITGTAFIDNGTIGGCSITGGVLKIKNVNIDEKLTADYIDAANLKVSSANITGEITATKVKAATGTIDTVTATNLTVTSGTIKLGDATLNASGISIAGTGSSTIAGWKILSNKITKNTVGISHDEGNYAFWAGGSESGTDPNSGKYTDGHNPAFAVRQNGECIAKSINITSGTIGGLSVVNDANSGGNLSRDGYFKGTYTYPLSSTTSINSFCLYGSTQTSASGIPNIMDLSSSSGTTLFKLSADGALTCNGVNNASSRRFKENIHNISDELLNNLSLIQTYEFDYIPEMGGRKNCLGVIAEEVMDIYPNAVSRENNLPQGVDYIYFIPLLIKKIQLMELELENLKNS